MATGGETWQGCSGPGFVGYVVLKLSTDGIDQADVVFAWLDDPTAYGTIAEIGYAYAKGKPVWIYYPFEAFDAPWYPDMWFSRSMSGGNDFGADDVFAAYSQFERWFPEALDFDKRQHRAREKVRSYYHASDRRTPRALSKGYVYLLRCGDVFKIGKTVELDRRVKQLSIQLPHAPVVEHSIRANHMDAAEVYYHSIFERERMNGEWFSLNENQVKWMKLTTTWDIEQHTYK